MAEKKKMQIDAMRRVAVDVGGSQKYKDICATARRHLGLCPKHHPAEDLVVEFDGLDRIYFSTKASPDVVVVRQSGENWTRLAKMDAVTMESARLNAARLLDLVTADDLLAYAHCAECKAEIDANIAKDLVVQVREDNCAVAFSTEDMARGMVVFINTESTTLPKYQHLRAVLA